VVSEAVAAKRRETHFDALPFGPKVATVSMLELQGI
jgi:hypothetical protein